LHSKFQLNVTSNFDGQWEWANLVKAYLLGDYLQDIDFKDTVMDAMVDWAIEATRECSDAPPYSSVEVYQHTKDNSPLRKIILDFTYWRLVTNFLMSMENFQYPSDFLTVVVSSLVERIHTVKIVGPNYVSKGYCQYHWHGDRTCYKDEDKSSKQEVRGSYSICIDNADRFTG
jgi:hypothetical protein